MQPSDLKEFLNQTRAAAKIIVVDLGFLGDTVHLVPALWEIKGHYPNAKLHVLTSPLGCELLGMAGCVDRAWAFPLGPPSPKWWQHWSVLRALRREKFDMAFNFSGADRTVFMTAVIRSRRSLVYQGARKHFWQPWAATDWVPRRKLAQPASAGRRQILELCGFTLQPSRHDLTVPEVDRQWANKIVSPGAVHLSLSASSPLKEWPLKNNLQFARNLLASDPELRLVATAAPSSREQDRLDQFRREIANPRLLAIGERLPVTRLAALLQTCSAHVGPDSGVLHLAAALNVPTVAIFRRYPDMADWLPTGPHHSHFDAPCPCVESADPPCARAKEADCLAGISAELVAAQVIRVVKEKAAKPAGHRINPSQPASM